MASASNGVYDTSSPGMEGVKTQFARYQDGLREGYLIVEVHYLTVVTDFFRLWLNRWNLCFRKLTSMMVKYIIYYIGFETLNGKTQCLKIVLKRTIKQWYISFRVFAHDRTRVLLLQLFSTAI